MYAGLNKEGGGIVGEGILAPSDGTYISLSEVADQTSAEESLVCLEQAVIPGEEVGEDERESAQDSEYRQVVMVSYIDSVSGEVGWKRAEEPGEVFRKTICTSQMTSMLSDLSRNQVYEKAIMKCLDNFVQKCHRPPSVLDIGAGTGLLSMLAARHGAECVIGCEMFETMAQVAEAVVSANDLDHKVQIVPVKSTDIDSESFEADILVSELLDSALLGEGCIPSHIDAIERGLLKSSLEADTSCPMEDRIIPHSAQVFARLVQSHEVTAMNDISTIDLSCACEGVSSEPITPFRDASAKHCVGNLNAVPLHWRELESRGKSVCLTEAVSVLNVNFFCARDFPTSESLENSDINAQHIKRTTVKIARAGTANAVLVWWKVFLLSPQLDPLRECTYSTEPGIHDWQDHWVQVVYPLTAPVSVEEDTYLDIICCRDSLRMWFSISDLKANKAISLKRPLDVLKNVDIQPPSPCSCGWHLLCDSDRLSALNDTGRMRAYRNAVAGSALAKFTELVTIESDKNGPSVVALDLSDGSVLAFMLASIIKNGVISSKRRDNDCNGKVVTMERKQFSSILSSQLVSANNLDDLVAVWDGVEFSSIPYLFGEFGELEGEDEEKEREFMIGMILCEDNFYQLKALPVAQAISFYYMRHSIRHRVLSGAPTIPQKANVMVAALELEDLAKSNHFLGDVSGFCHKPLDEARRNWFEHSFPYKLSQYRKKFLTTPTHVLAFDYQEESIDLSPLAWTVSVPISDQGTLHAIAIWVDYQLSPEEMLSAVYRDRWGSYDFREYLKIDVRFFESPVLVSSSNFLEVKAYFAFGDSEVALQYSIF